MHRYQPGPYRSAPNNTQAARGRKQRFELGLGDGACSGALEKLEEFIPSLLVRADIQWRLLPRGGPALVFSLNGAIRKIFQKN